jgi:hypothetical protein
MPLLNNLIDISKTATLAIFENSEARAISERWYTLISVI